MFQEPEEESCRGKHNASAAAAAVILNWFLIFKQFLHGNKREFLGFFIYYVFTEFESKDKREEQRNGDSDEGDVIEQLFIILFTFSFLNSLIFMLLIFIDMDS